MMTKSLGRRPILDDRRGVGLRLSDTVMYSMRYIALTWKTNMGKIIEDKLPDYFGCLLDFLAKDISAKLTLLEGLVKRVTDESDEIGDTADTVIPEEEMMLALLLLPLTRRYPELGKQISILEHLEVPLSKDSEHHQNDLVTNDTKLDKLL